MTQSLLASLFRIPPKVSEDAYYTWNTVRPTRFTWGDEMPEDALFRVFFSPTNLLRIRTTMASKLDRSCLMPSGTELQRAMGDVWEDHLPQGDLQVRGPPPSVAALNAAVVARMCRNSVHELDAYNRYRRDISRQPLADLLLPIQTSVRKSLEGSSRLLR